MRLTCEQGRCAPRNSVAQNKKSKKMTTLVMMYDGYWIVVLFGGSTSRTRFDLWSLVFQQYFITLNRCKVMTIVINKFEVWSYSLRSEFKQCCTSTSCESWPRTPPHEEPFLFQSLVAFILKRRSSNTHFEMVNEPLSLAAWSSFEKTRSKKLLAIKTTPSSMAFAANTVLQNFLVKILSKTLSKILSKILSKYFQKYFYLEDTICKITLKTNELSIPDIRAQTRIIIHQKLRRAVLALDWSFKCK